MGQMPQDGVATGAHTGRMRDLFEHFGTVGATALAPKGPRGLWAAMVEARGPEVLPPLSGDEAHLGYLERLSTPVPARPDGTVVSLDAYRLRRLGSA